MEKIILDILTVIGVGGIFIIILSILLNISLRVYNYYLDRKLKRLKRENALLGLENVKLAYDNLMYCRTNYYKARFIEDSEKRTETQKELKLLYEKQLKILSDPNYVSNQEYLTDKELAELKEVLARPRYGLV